MAVWLAFSFSSHLSLTQSIFFPKVRFNPNKQSFTWLATGGGAGLARLHLVKQVKRWDVRQGWVPKRICGIPWRSMNNINEVWSKMVLSGGEISEILVAHIGEHNGNAISYSKKRMVANCSWICEKSGNLILERKKKGMLSIKVSSIFMLWKIRTFYARHEKVFKDRKIGRKPNVHWKK